ncbi:hypothetical protein FBU59_001034 [Linderina macrospora]|uniref:Uncharacterized protein n=1 Tax=Linderina macrospora TaxID=4868 RepID=A0ACC1JF78_9FUNG|nr:hypothetical protein FBU59_001034 [Linderina macrospora]
MNNEIRDMVERLPTYSFFMVLSQLISRICHPNNSVFAVLERIILSVLNAYPQQTLWHLVSIQWSTDNIRAERCKMILAKAKAMHRTSPGSLTGRGHSQRIATMIGSMTWLTDQLLELCNATPPPYPATLMSMSRSFRDLVEYTSMDIIVPLQRSLTPLLPDMSHSGADYELALSPMPTGAAGGTRQPTPQQAMSHRPFPSSLPTIIGFADIVTIMSSKQRPKKIEIPGSDGQRYPFLCKPNDDLRKDARVMEVNAMINKLFQAD